MSEGSGRENADRLIKIAGYDNNSLLVHCCFKLFDSDKEGWAEPLKALVERGTEELKNPNSRLCQLLASARNNLKRPGAYRARTIDALNAENACLRSVRAELTRIAARDKKITLHKPVEQTFAERIGTSVTCFRQALFNKSAPARGEADKPESVASSIAENKLPPLDTLLKRAGHP